MWIDGNTCTHSFFLYGVNSSVKMGRRLEVYCQNISACFFEVINVLFRFYNHQVNIERLLRNSLHRFYHGQPKRNIRNKSPIHNITMNPIGFTAIEHFNFIPEAKEVSRENRGCNQRHAAKIVRSSQRECQMPGNSGIKRRPSF